MISPLPDLQQRPLREHRGAAQGELDQVIAQRVSEALASQLNCTVVATAGFHRDGISREGIKRVLENAEKLAEKISTALRRLKCR